MAKCQWHQRSQATGILTSLRSLDVTLNGVTQVLSLLHSDVLPSTRRGMAVGKNSPCTENGLF